MSLERTEGQPRQELALRRPPPKIFLLDHAKHLKTNLEEKLGKIIFQNDELIATQKEYRKQFSTDYIGHIYVHNKQNGLPNYGVKYKRTAEQIFMQAAYLWDYEVIDDPEPSLPPLLVASEIIAEKSGALGASSTRVIKTILDLENKEDLLWGESSKKNLVRKPDVFYGEIGDKIIHSVQSQIDNLTIFRKNQK